MSFPELDGKRLSELLRSEPNGVFVDFWSPWCAPCRVLRPHLHRLSEERSAWSFVAVNAEAHPEAAEAHGVSALPTLIWFNNGEELTRLAGAVTLSSVDETFDALG